MPFLGDCAIRHMGAVLSAFETELFPALSTKRTDMPVVPEGARQSTLNINSVHGGQVEAGEGLPSPCVPDSCRMIIDRRFLIEETIDDVKDEVGTFSTPQHRTTRFFLFHAGPVRGPAHNDRQGPTCCQGSEFGHFRYPGNQPGLRDFPGTYDQKHIDRIGKLKDCIAYGPGILDLAHQPDEYVGIEDMLDSAKIMATAIQTLLARKPPEVKLS